jgi:protein-S-isoprenylcysteine O-methyltransferase Ste14
MFDSIFEVIWLIGFIVGSVIRAVYARRPKKDEITVNRNTRLERLLLFLSSLGLIVLPFFYVFSPWLDFADYHLPTWAGWFGVAIFAFALWLLWKSHVDLGRNFTPTLQLKEKHTLVTHGVFRYTRHPIYAAHGLWSIAQALLLQNWIAGLSMLVFFLPLYLVRVPNEEKMMLEHFGEEYRVYTDKTGRLIPRRLLGSGHAK